MKIALVYTALVASIIALAQLQGPPPGLDPSKGGHVPVEAQQATAKAKANIKLEKTKAGLWKANWDVLRQYDLKTKKVGKNLKQIIDKKVYARGFMIPLDYSGKNKLTEFLLVPYVPSCMHVPPPPENQIVHVKFKKGQTHELSWFPVQVTGKLTLNKKRIDTSFEMTAETFKPEKK